MRYGRRVVTTVRRTRRGDVRRGRDRRRWVRPATVAAGLVLVGIVIAAVVSSSSGSSDGPVAARMGASAVTAAQVNREVDAIVAVPSYQHSLQGLGTLSLAAPVSPKAVAAASGDPDDLLITFAPAGGASSARPFTTADLAASVLTRWLYVTSLQQVLAERHVQPTAAQMADGREQARVEAGADTHGVSIYDHLPSWYQKELATRAADVEALAESIAGPGAVAAPAVEAYYDRTAISQYTTICLRGVSTGTRPAASATDEGCAPLAYWTPDVVAAVSRLPTGVSTPPLRHDGKTLVLTVTSRTTEPRTAVAGNVVAEMLAPYVDTVDNLVTAHVGLEKVTVAAQFGTYQSLGTTFGVLPPDALTPPPSSGQSGLSKTRPTLPSEQFDPFS
jgi:hypothetical protein